MELKLNKENAEKLGLKEGTEIKILEKAGTNLSPAVEKIIKVFYLKPRDNDPRVFYEGFGIGNYNDYNYIQSIIPDFKLDVTGSYAWTGSSVDELLEIDYTEGDIYLIVYNNIKELEQAIKRSKEFAKENW